MNDIEKILLETTTKIMKDNCTYELVTDAEEGKYPSELWEALEEMGMVKVAIPESLGGSDFGFKESLNILKIAGKYSAPIPLAETYIGNWFLYRMNMSIVDGALAIAPLDMGSIIVDMAGDSCTLTGTVKNVPFARNVNHVLIVGRNKSNDQLVAVVANVNDAEITESINLAGEPRDALTFNNVTVNEPYKVITKEDYDYLYDIYTMSKVILTAGAIENTLDLSIQFANERNQFGRPIGKFQAIKQQLAVLASQVTSSNVAVDYAIDSINNEGEMRREVAIAKTHIGEAAEIATSISHQVHAAIGFTHEHRLHHSTRRLWSWRDECGSESEWAKYLGKQILSESPESLWEIVTE